MLQIKLKSLKQVEYIINVDSDKITVKELKNEIEKLYSFDSDKLKLISNGVILENSKTLEEYKITNESTIIIMNTKLKENSSVLQNSKITSQNTQNIQNIENPYPKISQKPNNQAQIFKSEDNYSIQVNSLVDMGFDRKESEKAIKVAKGRIDLAIDYLNNGIPSTNPDGTIKKINPEIEKELRKNAAVIKIMCEKQSNKIFRILDNIKFNEPGLFNLIKDYRNEFKIYLNEPINERDRQLYQDIQDKIKTMDDDLKNKLFGAFQNNNSNNNMSNTSNNNSDISNNSNSNKEGQQLTDAEKEIVNRIKNLGNFSYEQALQAFITCDKNEEYTINFLFELSNTISNKENKENEEKKESKENKNNEDAKDDNNTK